MSPDGNSIEGMGKIDLENHAGFAMLPHPRSFGSAWDSVPRPQHDTTLGGQPSPMRKRSQPALVALFFGLVLMASVAVSGAEAAGEPGTPRINLGEALPLWSCIPFAGMLLSIALCPLVTPNFWHHHFGKVSAFWAASMGAPVPARLQRGGAARDRCTSSWRTMSRSSSCCGRFTPFPAGSCCGGPCGGPRLVNSLMLVLGTALASWMGTTGASMLLIRPFLTSQQLP